MTMTTEKTREQELEAEIESLEDQLRDAEDDLKNIERDLEAVQDELREAQRELERAADDADDDARSKMADALESRIHRIKTLGLDTDKTALDVLEELLAEVGR